MSVEVADGDMGRAEARRHAACGRRGAGSTGVRRRRQRPQFRDAIQDGTAVWARTSKDERAFFMRMNNSTRLLAEAELPANLVDRWPEQAR